MVQFPGDCYRSIHQQFRVGLSTVPEILYETLDEIYKTLKDKYLQVTPQLQHKDANISASNIYGKTYIYNYRKIKN